MTAMTQDRSFASRLLGAREPHLRADVPRERLEVVWADVGEHDALRRSLDSLRERLVHLGDAAGPKSEVSHE